MIFSQKTHHHHENTLLPHWFGLKTRPFDFIGKCALKLKKRANELLVEGEKAANELNNLPHRTKTIAENA